MGAGRIVRKAARKTAPSISISFWFSVLLSLAKLFHIARAGTCSVAHEVQGRTRVDHVIRTMIHDWKTMNSSFAYSLDKMRQKVWLP